MDFSGKIEFYRSDDSVLIVEYEGYDDPGKISGPPEDCYPPDSEMNIVEVVAQGKPFDIIDFESLPEDEQDRIIQACWDDVAEANSQQSESEWYAELNRGYAQDRI